MQPDIPEQLQGKQSDNEYSVSANDRTEACALFEDAVRRLLDVNNWNKIAGAGSAVFQVTDGKGNATSSELHEGYYLKIDVPGPGTTKGKGYDWVRIEKMEKERNPQAQTEFVSFTVRPASNPQTKNENDTAHFFKETATSTFLVKRDGNTVSAEVHGRNEMANTQTQSTIDNLRNKVLVSTGVPVFSDMQWKRLVRGIIDGD